MDSVEIYVLAREYFKLASREEVIEHLVELHRNAKRKPLEAVEKELVQCGSNSGLS